MQGALQSLQTVPPPPSFTVALVAAFDPHAAVIEKVWRHAYLNAYEFTQLLYPFIARAFAATDATTQYYGRDVCDEPSRLLLKEKAPSEAVPPKEAEWDGVSMAGAPREGVDPSVQRWETRMLRQHEQCASGAQGVGTGDELQYWLVATFAVIMAQALGTTTGAKETTPDDDDDVLGPTWSPIKDSSDAFQEGASFSPPGSPASVTNDASGTVEGKQRRVKEKPSSHGIHFAQFRAYALDAALGEKHSRALDIRAYTLARTVPCKALFHTQKLTTCDDLDLLVAAAAPAQQRSSWGLVALNLGTLKPFAVRELPAAHGAVQSLIVVRAMENSAVQRNAVCRMHCAVLGTMDGGVRGYSLEPKLTPRFAVTFAVPITALFEMTQAKRLAIGTAKGDVCLCSTEEIHRTANVAAGLGAPGREKYDPKMLPLVDRQKYHTGAVTCFEKDVYGESVFSGSADCVIIQYNIREKRVVRRLTGHRHGILSIAFNSFDNTLVSCGHEFVPYVWGLEVNNPSPVKLDDTSSPGQNMLVQVYAIPDRPVAVTLDTKGTFRLWHLRQARCVVAVGCEPDVARSDLAGVAWPAFAVDAKTMDIVTAANRKVYVLSYGSSSEDRPLAAHSAPVTALTHDPDEGLLYSAARSELHVWLAAEGRTVTRLREVDADGITALLALPEIGCVVVGTAAGALKVYSTATFTLEGVWIHQAQRPITTLVSLAPIGRGFAAIASGCTRAEVVDIIPKARGDIIGVPLLRAGVPVPAGAVALCPEQSAIVVGEARNKLSLWHVVKEPPPGFEPSDLASTGMLSPRKKKSSQRSSKTGSPAGSPAGSPRRSIALWNQSAPSPVGVTFATELGVELEGNDNDTSKSRSRRRTGEVEKQRSSLAHVVDIERPTDGSKRNLSFSPAPRGGPSKSKRRGRGQSVKVDSRTPSVSPGATLRGVISDAVRAAAIAETTHETLRFSERSSLPLFPPERQIDFMVAVPGAPVVVAADSAGDIHIAAFAGAKLDTFWLLWRLTARRIPGLAKQPAMTAMTVACGAMVPLVLYGDDYGQVTVLDVTACLGVENAGRCDIDAALIPAQHQRRLHRGPDVVTVFDAHPESGVSCLEVLGETGIVAVGSTDNRVLAATLGGTSMGYYLLDGVAGGAVLIDGKRTEFDPEELPPSDLPAPWGTGPPLRAVTPEVLDLAAQLQDEQEASRRARAKSLWEAARSTRRMRRSTVMLDAPSFLRPRLSMLGASVLSSEATPLAASVKSSGTGRRAGAKPRQFPLGRVDEKAFLATVKERVDMFGTIHRADALVAPWQQRRASLVVPPPVAVPMQEPRLAPAEPPIPLEVPNKANTRKVLNPGVNVTRMLAAAHAAREASGKALRESAAVETEMLHNNLCTMAPPIANGGGGVGIAFGHREVPHLAKDPMAEHSPNVMRRVVSDGGGASNGGFASHKARTNTDLVDQAFRTAIDDSQSVGSVAHDDVRSPNQTRGRQAKGAGRGRPPQRLNPLDPSVVGAIPAMPADDDLPTHPQSQSEPLVSVTLAKVVSSPGPTRTVASSVSPLLRGRGNPSPGPNPGSNTNAPRVLRSLSESPSLHRSRTHGPTTLTSPMKHLRAVARGGNSSPVGLGRIIRQTLAPLDSAGPQQQVLSADVRPLQPTASTRAL